MGQQTYFITLGRVTSCTNNLQNMANMPVPESVSALLKRVVEDLEAIQNEMRYRWDRGEWPEEDAWPEGGYPELRGDKLWS